MKTLIIFCLIILLAAFTAGTAGPVQPLLQLQLLEINITWYVVLLLIIGLYEVVVRVIPSFAKFAIIGLIIDILKLISDYLKRKKK